MPPVFHYPTRQFDGVLDTLHGCHSAGCKCISFNDRCVHLHFAETIEGGSGAGVKERVVFENNHGGFSGIERRTTLFEYLPTRRAQLPYNLPIAAAALRRGFARHPRGQLSRAC